MDAEILNMIAAYGVETIMIGIIINILTNFAKKPIKAYSKKSGNNINKYISLIPVILGFAGAVLYHGLMNNWTNLNIEKIVTLGLSSASLSLAVFAIFEKFFPKQKKCSESEAEDVSIADGAVEIINKLNQVMGIVTKITAGGEIKEIQTENSEMAVAEVPAGNPPQRKKIILGRKVK